MMYNEYQTRQSQMDRVRAKAYKSLINPGKRRLENRRSKCAHGSGCAKNFG